MAPPAAPLRRPVQHQIARAASDRRASRDPGPLVGHFARGLDALLSGLCQPRPAPELGTVAAALERHGPGRGFSIEHAPARPRARFSTPTVDTRAPVGTLSPSILEVHLRFLGSRPGAMRGLAANLSTNLKHTRSWASHRVHLTDGSFETIIPTPLPEEKERSTWNLSP